MDEKLYDIELLQGLLLKWFSHYEKISISKIRIGCNNLFEENIIKKSNPLYLLFYPLVRQGLIEFSGDGKYHLANSSIFFNDKLKTAIGINLSKTQKLKLTSNYEHAVEDKLGIVRLTTTKKSIQQFCVNNNVSLNAINVNGTFSNFPTIEKVIHSLNKVSITSNVEYYNIRYRRWEKTKEFKNGIFRISDDSVQKYFRIKNKYDLSIPSSNYNPEIRFIAEIYQAKLEEIDFISYDRKAKKLKVIDAFLPILIERFLRLASFHNTEGVFQDSKTTIYSNIDLSTVKEMQRIFGVKIL